MPANLPPHYHKVQRRYSQAKTPEEKIEILREMLAIMPKHKGTDHLQADVRRRMALHRREAQQTKKVKRSASLDYIEREGEGQVALVGAPNSGKSSILAAVTHAKSEVADYPFTTYRPLPGMMPFEDIQVQLVDLPPISEYTESWVFNVVRNVDLTLLVVHLSSEDPGEQVLAVLDMLEGSNILLTGRDPERDANQTVISKKTLIVGTRGDEERSAAGIEVLQELYGEEFRIIRVSTTLGEGLEEMRREIFLALNILRIYTKVPGKEPDMESPYVLPVGSTVLDVVTAIHRDMEDTLKFARIWGSEKYDGQQVQRDYRVKDRDIIEIHA